jgi:formylglycine-generating enzyme required for sulfatase activity
MVLIHSKDSAFLMGSNNGYSYEKPVHSVTFTYDFWMDSTEVTQADFSTVMGFNPSLFSSVINGPVEYVTWFDAALYCNNRSKRDGLYTIYTYTTKKNGRILLS